jgi:hypothetical protein
MYTCSNKDCGKKAVYLLEGKLCSECFVPPIIDDLPKEPEFKDLKTLPCNYVECKKPFKQEHPHQGYCDDECKRLQKILYAREYRKENK